VGGRPELAGTNGLGGIALALAFAAALICIPALNSLFGTAPLLFGTAPLTAGQLATVLPFPFSVWGADEFRRLLVRRRGQGPPPKGN
jgi:hypothetical protein